MCYECCVCVCVCVHACVYMRRTDDFFVLVCSFVCVVIDKRDVW